MKKKLSDHHPPYRIICKVVEQCPEAAALYLHLWVERDRSSDIYVKKRDIQQNFSLSIELFITKIKALEKQNACTFKETETAFSIHLERQ